MSYNFPSAEKKKSVKTYFSISTLACLMVANALHSQTTETWDNGSGSFTWDTASLNWGGLTWKDGNNASFGATGVGVITVNGTRSVGNLLVSSAGYIFTNGVLAVTNGSGTIHWTLNNNATIASPVTAIFTGSGDFEKSGPGWLIQSGPVIMNGDTNNGNFFHVWSGSGSGMQFAGNANFTNVLLLPGVTAGSIGNVLILGGTDVFTGTASKRGLAVNGGATLTVGGGNITADRLIVAFGSNGTYVQTNGIVTVTGTIGGGVSQPVGVEMGTGATATQYAKLTLSGGTLIALGIWPNPFANWAGTGTIYLNGGTFQCAGDSTNLLFTDVPTSAGGAIYIGQSTNGSAPFTNGATIDTAGFSVTQVQPLLAGTPSGGLTKLGAGTLDLAGANTYTDQTTVSNGTLLVDGSLAVGSTVSVAEGTLGGSGTINGPVSVDAGGTVVPGSSAVGTLTIDNDLTLNSGAGAMFRLNTANSPATNDSLVVSGTQSITGSTLTVVNAGPPLQVGDSFTLLSQATSGFTTVNLPVGYTWANHLAADGSIQVLQVLAPPPTTTPTNIAYSVNGNQMLLNWDSNQGWQLLVQTNGLATGLSTNWLTMTGAVPPYPININPTNPAVFYRLGQGKNLFVSPNGSDSNAGTLGEPLKTLAAALPLLHQGDTLYLRGGTYRETLNSVNSGTSVAPITIAAYSNEVVTLTGCDVVTNTWTYTSNGVYATSVRWDLGEGYNQVFVDGVMQHEAQYPNWTGTNSLLNPPTVSVKVYNNYTISNTGSTGFGSLGGLDLTGAHFLGGVGQAWAWQTAVVSSNNSQSVFLDTNTATTTWWWPNQANAKSQTGVGLVYGKLNLLDVDGEWYYDVGSSTLYLRIAGEDHPSTHTVEMKRRTWCVNLSGNHVMVRRMVVRAGAIELNGTGDVLESCDAGYLSHYLTFASGASRNGGLPQGGGVVLGGSNNTVCNCAIHDTAGCGINASSGGGDIIMNNLIYNTDYAGTYAGCISLNGTGDIVRFNTAHDSGRDILVPSGSGHDIEYNDLSHSGRLCLDLGVIYIYGQDAAASGTPTHIAHNWVHDGNLNDPLSKGIYLDNGSRNFLVDHNVIWNMGTGDKNDGIHLNSPADGTQLYHNTLFSCGTYDRETWDNFPASNPDPSYWSTTNNHLFYTAQNNLVLTNAAMVSSDLMNAAAEDFQLQATSGAVDPTLTTNVISWWTTNGMVNVPSGFDLTEAVKNQLYSYQEVTGQGVVLPGINDDYVGVTPDNGAYEYGIHMWRPGTNGTPAQ